jgi:LDH2 family malate/lactate/ureidoglycolate dehydrogenase
VEALKGFVQPVGGAKGYALTLTIGLLSTMLSGAFFGSEVTHLYEDLERPQNVGHLVGVLPVSLFEEPVHFAARMDKAIREVRSVRRAPGVERIYLPGERERLLMAERQRTGIPLATAILAELDAVGARYGVALEREI